MLSEIVNVYKRNLATVFLKALYWANVPVGDPVRRREQKAALLATR